MSDAEKPRRGALRWVGRKSVDMATAYPRAAWRSANPGAIRDEAENIRRLWAIVRSPRPEAVGIIADAGGRIDIQATAEVAGITPEEVSYMLSLRLRRTAATFWSCLLVGAGGFAVWAAAAIAAPQNFSELWTGTMTLLLTLTLGAKALEAALHNWQVRVLRLGSVGEFLRTADTLFPKRRVGYRPI